ncbi:hypothetical protein [Clostridium sp. DJ247]|uniref:hypothetical protein n=1 Tax=Clostridium sp. DJ247 TaxID=2726188 RepID=UPI0016273978|nr:hypothetical protein [Clostridium sp. DJ247]MBC2579789.1 hypothetical protein [Clostridium sp. DJ247]
MLKLSILEFLFRVIPESFTLIFAGYAFSSKVIDKKSFCISSIVLSVITYLVRMLPIHFGVHTIILLIIYMLTTVTINKIDIIKSLSAGLISAILMYTCEWVNAFIITDIFKKNLDTIMKNHLMKLLYFSPSLLLFAIIIIFIYTKNVYLRKVPKNVSN